MISYKLECKIQEYYQNFGVKIQFFDKNHSTILPISRAKIQIFKTFGSGLKNKLILAQIFNLTICLVLVSTSIFEPKKNF